MFEENRDTLLSKRNGIVLGLEFVMMISAPNCLEIMWAGKVRGVVRYTDL